VSVDSYGAAQTSEAVLSILYKIMTKKQWEQAQANGSFTGSEVDIKDGFIHLSAAHQVRATAEKHFAGQTDLVLVSVEEENLGPMLKWEVSRGDNLFPHVYGPLPLAAVDHVVALPLINGAHQFPESFP
jgi:uncharacterized protein (DUF952 family)